MEPAKLYFWRNISYICLFIISGEEGIHLRALRPRSSDLNMYSEWTFNNSVQLNIFRTDSCLGEMNISQRNKFETWSPRMELSYLKCVYKYEYS